MSARRATALVTGGAGFIGSNLVRGLVAKGYAVRVIDDLSTGREANLAGIEGDVRLVRRSILDHEALTAVTEGCRFVFHQAAQVSVPASLDDPAHNHEVNATGTLRVLEAARAAGVERVVIAASCAIYGNDPRLPKAELDPIDPQSPYAATKYFAEVYGACYSATMGLEVVALRYFNVFGPRQSPSGGYAAVIPVFIDRLLRGEAPIIHGDGLQTRDFVFIDNVVEANLAAASAPGVGGRVFNVGTGVEVSILDLATRIATLVGRQDLQPVHEASRPGDVLRSVADVSRARRELGYEGRVDIAAGLERTVGWFREAP